MNNQINYPILDGRYLYDKINKKIENGEDINVYEQFYLWSIHNRSKILYGLFILFILCIIINDITEYRQNKIVIQSGGTGDETSEGKGFFGKSLSVSKSIGKGIGTGLKVTGKGVKMVTIGKDTNIGTGIKGFGEDIWKGTKNVGKGVGNVLVGKTPLEDLGKVGKGAAKVRSAFTKNIAFGKRDPSKMSQYELERYKKLEETKKNREYKTLGAMKDAFTFFPLIDKLFGKIWNVVWNTKVGVIIGFMLLVYGFGAVIVPLIILYLLIKYTLKILKKKTKSFQDYKRFKKIVGKQYLTR